MKCEKCGSTVILKYTPHLNGGFSKHWECPVCGAIHKDTRKTKLDGVLLK